MSRVIILVGFMVVCALCLPRGQKIPDFVGITEPEANNGAKCETNDSEYNKLVLSFVVFRHGDRTPDQIELDKYPSGNFNDSIFYPYGKKALTNKGKERAFRVGEYLRKRYNDTISELYLPNEISVRTTDFARTKMTALAALAAMYPPATAQMWSPKLHWQPIPYDTIPWNNDDLLYFGNCLRYAQLKSNIYNLPEIRDILSSYEDLFNLLNAKTEANITTPENVFFLDNLFQALTNVGVTHPQWIEDIMPQIKEMTKIEYFCMYYNKELITLSSGVLMSEIIDAMNATIAGDEEQVKLRLYSAHEINVAAVLAAVGAFKPHQPKYGSTVSLELRQNTNSGKYGVMVVYAEEAGGPGVVLPVGGCGEQPVCDYDTFITLIKDVLLPRSEYTKLCSTPLS